MKGKRVRGELYWPFRCQRGHSFDLGPIHDPEASEPDPDNPGGLRSVPGSGTDAHVPDTAWCPECLRDGARVQARPR
jgi:hypothetical protein